MEDLTKEARALILIITQEILAKDVLTDDDWADIETLTFANGIILNWFKNNYLANNQPTPPKETD